MTPAVLLLQVGAAAISLFGYLLLARGAFGSGTAVTPGQGVALLSIALLYGWWLSPVAAATGGIRGALLALAVIDVLWVLLGQGLAGIALCALAFCPDLAPWSDLVRYGSVVLGAAAALSAWNAYRARPGPTEWAPALTAVAIVVVSFTLQGLNAEF